MARTGARWLGIVDPMDIEQIWSAGLSVLALTTNYLAGNGRRYAWVIGIISQIGWIGFMLLTTNYGFLISITGFTVVYIRNFILWGRRTHQAAAEA